MPTRVVEAVLEVGHAGAIVVTDGGGAVTFNVPAADAPTTALDTGLQTALNASALAGTYTVARSATTGLLTITRTDPGTFTLSLSSAAMSALGFTSASYGAASSRTGESRAAYCLDCLGIELSDPKALQDVRAEAVRHGRVESSVWGSGRLWKVTAWVRASAMPTSHAWFSGRVRVVPASSTTALSETALGGAVTGLVKSARFDTVDEGLVRWSAEVVEVA